MVGGERLAVGLVGDQRVLVLDRLERHVGGEALVGVRDDEAPRRASAGQLRELAPVHALERRVEPTPAGDAVDVDRDLAARQLASCSHVSIRGGSTSPDTARLHVARSTSGTEPACSTGHFSVRYWPGGRRAGSYPASATLASALDLNRGTLPRLTSVQSVSVRAALRPRAYVRVAGPDAEDYLQRMLSNDVTAGDLVPALLLTPKGRLIAPVRMWRRGPEDFLLLTEPELGEVVRATLLRSRFASKCEIEPEQHTSSVVFGESEGLPGEIPGTVEVLDAVAPGTAGERRAGACADRSGRAGLGQGARRRDPPCGGRPRRDAHLVHEGLLPGPGAGRAPAAPGHVEPAAARARGRVGARQATRSRSRASRSAG